MGMLGLRYGVQQGGWDISGLNCLGMRTEDFSVESTVSDLKAKIAEGFKVDYILVLTSLSTAMMINLNTKAVYSAVMVNDSSMSFDLFFDIGIDFEQHLISKGIDPAGKGFDCAGNAHTTDDYDIKLGETKWWVTLQTPEQYSADVLSYIPFIEWLEGLGYVFTEDQRIAYPVLNLD